MPYLPPKLAGGLPERTTENRPQTAPTSTPQTLLKVPFHCLIGYSGKPLLTTARARIFVSADTWPPDTVRRPTPPHWDLETTKTWIFLNTTNGLITL